MVVLAGILTLPPQREETTGPDSEPVKVHVQRQRHRVAKLTKPKVFGLEAFNKTLQQWRYQYQPACPRHSYTARGAMRPCPRYSFSARLKRRARSAVEDRTVMIG